MRFPVVFSRYVGGVAGQPVLGDGTATGDLIPKSDAPNYAVGSTGTNSTANGPGDNVYSCARLNLAGWPPQRIAIGCRYVGAATPAAIPVNVYLYDQASGTWFKMNAAAITVTPTITTGPGVQPTSVGPIVYFDIPAIMDKPPTAQNLGDANAMGISVMIQPINTGNTLNNGEYRFIVAGDMSSNP